MRMRITFDNLERKDTSCTTFLLSSSPSSLSYFFLYLFSSFSSHHARAERDSEKFFFHPRFLDSDLMELKSFRDAHRCALYSHAARGTRRKNSLRAKKENPDRWSTIWEINYRARRNLAEIISHGSAIVIAVVVLKRAFCVRSPRIESLLIDTLILSLTKIVHHAHDIITDWCCFFYIVLSFYNKKGVNCFRRLSFPELMRSNYHIILYVQCYHKYIILLIKL